MQITTLKSETGAGFDIAVMDVPAERVNVITSLLTNGVFPETKSSLSPISPITGEPLLISSRLEEFVQVFAQRDQFNPDGQGMKLRKIPLIKAVRCLTLMGLKEAKDFVEAVLDKHQITCH